MCLDTTIALTELMCDRTSTTKQVHGFKATVQDLYEDRLVVMQRQVEQAVKNHTGISMDLGSLFDKFNAFWIKNEDATQERQMQRMLYDITQAKSVLIEKRKVVSPHSMK